MRHRNFYILYSTFYILVMLPSLSFAHPTSIWPGGYWGPLVSCTGSLKTIIPGCTPSATNTCLRDNPNPCTSLCDLIDTFLHVVYFGITLVVFVFTPIFFAWGGIMILISSGDPGKLQKGKQILTGTLIGVGITLGAFLIVSTFVKFLGVATNPATGKPFIGGFDSSGSFSCQVQAVLAPPGGAVAGGGGLSNAGAVAQLAAARIDIAAPSLEGIQQATVDELIRLKRSCNCDVVVTSATTGGHASGRCSHANGWKADLKATSNINSYITSNFQRVGTRSDGAPLYGSSGAAYADERNLPGVAPHWDVAIAC